MDQRAVDGILNLGGPEIAGREVRYVGEDATYEGARRLTFRHVRRVNEPRHPDASRTIQHPDLDGVVIDIIHTFIL